MLSFAATSRQNPVATHFYMDNTTSSKNDASLCHLALTGKIQRFIQGMYLGWDPWTLRGFSQTSKSLIQHPATRTLQTNSIPNPTGITKLCVEPFLLNHHFLANSTNEMQFKASRVRQHTQIQALTLHQETEAKITSGPMSCTMCSLSPSSTRVGPTTLRIEPEKESLVADFLVLGVGFRF